MFEYKRLIKKSLGQKTLFSDLFGYGLIATGFANKYLAGNVTMYKSYNWLYKKFKNDVGKAKIEKQKNAEKDYVWICWLQGIENAPEIVQNCYASVKYWLGDKEIVVITSENMAEYVSFPDFIIEKYKKGIISNAHLSDLLRLELLIRYGGLWLDATTYLTGKLPSYVENNDFFVYRNGQFDMEMINMGNWLIYSKKTNNKLLVETRVLLYKYWQKYNFTKNYFIFHMFFRMATDYYTEEWNSVPYINQIDQHLLMQELEKDIDYARVEEIRNISSVHKLTYKIDIEDKPKATARKLNDIYLEQS